jgi:polyhydroxyalkanoate synthesis regulator phasin
MADNSNTLQLTLQIKDDGTIVIDKAVGKIKDLEGQTEKGTKGLGSFSEGWLGITAKITAATAVVYGVIRAFSSFVTEAAEAEAIENRLKFALETTGYTWQYAKSAVDEFASSVQASTRFSDEQARSSLTDMMMYTQDFSKAQMGAKLAMDMSIRTGQDLGSTNRLIGMAMSGNVEMLGRYIPQLRNLDNILGSNASMAQKAEYALKILQQKFGGTAQADLDSYAGKVAQFKNQWSDLKEEIGGKTLPILGDLLGMLTKVSQRLTLGIGGGIEKAQLEFQLKVWEQRYEILKEQPGFEAEVLECEEKIWAVNEKLAVLYEKIGEDRRRLAAETKKDIFPDKDFTELLNKSLEDDAKAWGIYADEQISGLEKLNQYKNEGTKTDLERQEWARGKIIEDEQVFNQEKIDAWAAVYMVQAAEDEEWVKMHEYALERIKEGEEEFRTTNIEAWAAYNNYLIEEEKNRINIGETLAQNMASAWNFNLKNIITDSKNMGDAVRKVFFGMADAFSSAVSKMISDWTLFGSQYALTGKTEKGAGLIGILGGGLTSLFGGGAAAGGAAFSAGEMAQMVWLQHGADFWANKPMIIGVGERGKERVTITPENQVSQSKQGGDTYYYIDARGAQKGVSAEIMRAIRESENRAVKRSVNTVADYKVRGGKFARIFE